mmetsp:Transcript_62703/g.103432  ORF Transcript_62703/g.103432 Transcript_62703/m.103432 type:complete len:240 (+) Transcript_62703:1040-1759(+)
MAASLFPWRCVGAQPMSLCRGNQRALGHSAHATKPAGNRPPIHQQQNPLSPWQWRGALIPDAQSAGHLCTGPGALPAALMPSRMRLFRFQLLRTMSRSIQASSSASNSIGTAASRPRHVADPWPPSDTGTPTGPAAQASNKTPPASCRPWLRRCTARGSSSPRSPGPADWRSPPTGAPSVCGQRRWPAPRCRQQLVVLRAPAAPLPASNRPPEVVEGRAVGRIPGTPRVRRPWPTCGRR